MRSSTILLTTTLALAPAAALGQCPDRVSGEFETTLGETVAWLEPGQTVHTPADLTMFGAPVSYVLVKRASEGGPIIEVDYRFKDVVRGAGEEYPIELRRGFDKAFTSDSCGARSNPVCTVAFNSKDASEGRITGGKLSMGDLWIPDDARGPALPLVQEDFDAENGDPVFLICLY